MAAHEPWIAAVAARQREVGEHLGHALVEDRAVVAAGFVAERTGQPTFPDPGRPFDDQVLRFLDPAPSGEALEQGAVEAACGAVVDILDDGLVTQPGVAQPRSQPTVVALGRLAVEQEAQPLGMGELGMARVRLEFDEGSGHPGEPQLLQLVEGGVGQQRASSSMVVTGAAKIGVVGQHQLALRAWPVAVAGRGRA